MTTIAPTVRAAVLTLYDGACHYRLSGCSGVAITADHIVPFSVSRVNAWWNLAPACCRCNEAKADAVGFCACWRCSFATANWRELKRTPPPQRFTLPLVKRARPKRARPLVGAGSKSWKYRPSTMTLDDILAARKEASKWAKGRCYAGGEHIEGTTPHLCVKCNALLSPLSGFSIPR